MILELTINTDTQTYKPTMTDTSGIVVPYPMGVVLGSIESVKVKFSGQNAPQDGDSVVFKARYGKALLTMSDFSRIESDGLPTYTGTIDWTGGVAVGALADKAQMLSLAGFVVQSTTGTITEWQFPLLVFANSSNFDKDNVENAKYFAKQASEYANDASEYADNTSEIVADFAQALTETNKAVSEVQETLSDLLTENIAGGDEVVLSPNAVFAQSIVAEGSAGISIENLTVGQVTSELSELKSIPATISEISREVAEVSAFVSEVDYSVGSELEIERNARSEADFAIQSELTKSTSELKYSVQQEANARSENDYAINSELSYKVSSEAGTRSETDSELAYKISSEATIRSEAVYKEQSERIYADSSEKTARENKDSELTYSISQVSENDYSKNSELAYQLNSEKNARSEADYSLNSELVYMVNSEATVRSEADYKTQSELSYKITSEVGEIVGLGTEIIGTKTYNTFPQAQISVSKIKTTPNTNLAVCTPGGILSVGATDLQFEASEISFAVGPTSAHSIVSSCGEVSWIGDCGRHCNHTSYDLYTTWFSVRNENVLSLQSCGYLSLQSNNLSLQSGNASLSLQSGDASLSLQSGSLSLQSGDASLSLQSGSLSLQSGDASLSLQSGSLSLQSCNASLSLQPGSLSLGSDILSLQSGNASLSLRTGSGGDAIIMSPEYSCIYMPKGKGFVFGRTLTVGGNSRFELVVRSGLVEYTDNGPITVPACFAFNTTTCRRFYVNGCGVFFLNGNKKYALVTEEV